MKRTSLKLVALASGMYYATLVAALSFSPGNFNPPLFLLAGPLLVLVFVLVSDLSYWATRPTEAYAKNPPIRKLAREVHEVAKQVEVASKASPEYFERVLLARLRSILVEKVSLETGIERERVSEVLSNAALGPGLLKDDQLYMLLYRPPPGRGPARVRMLEDAVERIEAWKL